MSKIIQFRGARAAGWAKDRWRWLGAIRRDARLSAMARLVAHALGFGFANSETAECRPGAQALADDCGTSLRTIERCMMDLEGAGWIARIGGEGPGVKAAIVFTFPGERPPVLAAERPPVLAATPAIPDGPPIPPYKDQPNMNHKANPNLRAQIRGPKRPHILTHEVAPGSARAARWDEWLAVHGHPPLSQIGFRPNGGGFLMPVSVAPRPDEEIPWRIAAVWVDWLRTKV